jgi:hypothetical protein
MSRELIKKIFSKLPPAEKKMPAVIIDGKTYTWEQVMEEVTKGGELADKIQKKIEEMRKENA